MNVLDIKMLRDLWSLRAQVVSIALLIASGIAVFVMSTSDYFALLRSMDSHYRNERLADLFASLKRAPNAVVTRLREADGIGTVESRIVQNVRVIRADTNLPISGRIVSIPRNGPPLLNGLQLLEGRWIDPTRLDEIIINEAYATARMVRLGDTLDIVLNSRLQSFRVVGVALSPEYVFATRSGLPLPDNRNLVIIWTSEDAVAGAFDMSGAFNDVTMTLAPDASEARVIEEVDRILAPYGGIGAYGRHELPSHRFLEDELSEQQTLSIAIPLIFFSIAAFLLHVILGRLVDAQREQIASLKALGFSNVPIALHYFKLVTLISLLGAFIGVALGKWLAEVVIVSYRVFFRFPDLKAQLDPGTIALAVLAAVLAANLGAASAVYRIARMTPSEAMRAPRPISFRVSPWLSRAPGPHVPLQFIMAARSILGRPVRTLFTVLGIALAVPLVLFGLFWFDAIRYMIDVSFGRIERGDAVITFTSPVSTTALVELRSVSGIMLAEGQRVVPIQLKAGHARYRTSLTGLSQPSELRVPRGTNLNPMDVPLDGLMLSRTLAELLGVTAGDNISMEILEGRRPVADMTVAKLSHDILGFSAYMTIEGVNRLLREGDLINAASLKIDPLQANNVWTSIKEMPMIEASSVKALWITLFDETIAGMIVIGALVLTAFGLLITVGVVYNSARTAYQERAWELASLRILGFTRAEVTAILVSELAFAVLLAIPIGLVAGRGLIGIIVSLRVSESFQIPVVIAPMSYAAAAMVVLLAAAGSAFAVRRRVDNMDLIGVLKTRE